LNLRANALLGMDGPLGHFTEVLSGDYYQALSTSSPHQIWSAAMVVNPVLRGMLGLDTDTLTHQITFAPHVPAEWSWLQIGNVRVEGCTLSLALRRTPDIISLDVRHDGTRACFLEFSPALSPRARVVRAELNGWKTAFTVQKNIQDQHVTVKVPVTGASCALRLAIRNDFGYSIHSQLPALGSGSRGLRVVSETWSKGFDSLRLELAGRPQATYGIDLWNGEQITSVEGAAVSKERQHLEVAFPQNPAQDYAHHAVVVHFGGGQRQ
jgi:hypothetical protein